MRVRDLAEELGGRVVGDGMRRIQGIADLEHADKYEIAYVDNDKLFAAAGRVKHGA